MLLELFAYLESWDSGFQAFQYLTLRGMLSVITALLISLLIGPWIIRKLCSYKIGQVVRDNGPESHLSKAGTPTMGGLMILIAVTLSTLLWADLSTRQIWIALFVMLTFGVIGGIDDYRKLVLKSSDGLSAKAKYALQSALAIAAVWAIYVLAETPEETQLIVPIFKDIVIDMGIFFVVFGYFVIVGTSNAVNLTDGLYGLAIMPTVLVAGAFAIIAYATGNVKFAEYLSLPHIENAGELMIFCAALVGAGLGFLWFNTYPAQVFMGDIGSLSLGAALGVVAIMVRQELLLVIMGGVFVAETISVILQVASYKLTKRRVFRMAPLHHHYELKGLPEPRVIVRFWIVTLVLVFIGLAMLKVR